MNNVIHVDFINRRRVNDPKEAFQAVLNDLERDLIEDALKEFGNTRETAQALCMTKGDLIEKIKLYKIKVSV